MKNSDIYTIVKNGISYLPVVGMLMLVAALPFQYGWVQRTALYILGISYPIDYILNRRWQGWHWTHDKWVYVVMILLFLLTPLWQLFDPTPPTDYYKFQLHQRSAFMWVSIAGLLGFSPRLHTRHVGVVMLLTGIYMFALTLYGYLHSDLPIWNIRFFNIYRAHHINSHMVMNLYMNTALIFGALGLSQWSKKGMKHAVVAMMLAVWCFILMIDGRVGFVTSLLIITIFFVRWCWHRKHVLGVLAFTICAMGSSVLVYFNDRITADKIGGDPRMAIWDYSIRRIAAHPWLGYGLSTNSVAYVEDAYTDKEMYDGFILRTIYAHPEFATQGHTMITHHPHNAFLEYWLENGIFGLLLFIALFVSAACMSFGVRRVYIWAFLLALGIQCMFEPIGDHLQPQFIALMLFCLQHEVATSTPAARNDDNDNPIVPA